MEKSCPERMFTRPPELPWASQLFTQFVTKQGESLVYEKQTVGSDRKRATCLAES